ncbi:MAG TPA: transposase [Candidatus Saccharimonadia bacterium]|nr:transposase [Candidatus Saccharimonadia bacterium]
MPTASAKPATTPIPVQLSATEFHQFSLPHLSMPKRGPRCKLGYHRVFNLILWLLYTGMQWKCLPVPTDTQGHAALHYPTVDKVFARWSDDGSLEEAFSASVAHLADHDPLDLSVLHGDGTNTVAKKGGDGIGYSGHKHQQGEKVIAIIDNHGYVLAPLPVAPVNKAETVLLPEGLKALKRVAKLTGLELDGASLNLDGGFDSKSNRKAIFNAGMIPNIKENPRNRQTPKRGRKRLFNAVIHALRERVERTFAWEDKFKRLLLRFEYIQQRHYGMKLMAYTLINVRRFCVP